MNYIVDTNILLEYPDFIKEPKRIVLTYSVVRELDSKKNVPGGLGFNSRIVSRYLDDCRKAGNIAEGVDTESGGWIIVVMDDELVHTDDSLVALGKSMTEQNLPCTLLSNDVNVRIKAACNGVATDGWGHDKKTAAVYGKIPEFWVSDNVVKTLFSSGKIDLTGFGHIPLHSYALLRSEINSNSTAIVFNDGLDLVVVGNKNKKIFGLSPKNIDQTCAFDALCRDNIPLVTLSGPAGSGKSLLAIAAGLDALIEQRKVDKIIIIRAPIPVGKDIGYLPGGMDEKMQAWAGPMYDNIDVLMNGNKKNIDMYFEKGLIEVVPTTFLRGRSLNRTFVILDEGQGLSAHEMKTVATRIGEGSRLIVTGDLEQIDNPKVSTDDNGLALLVGAFKDTKWAVCLDLIKGERSGFSAAAADLL